MAGGVLSVNNLAALNLHFSDVRYAYDANGNTEYIGWHYVHNAPTTDSKWVIFKQTIGVNGITRQEKLVGSWDNRATLDWG